jgi:hypothetical protein
LAGGAILENPAVSIPGGLVRLSGEGENAMQYLLMCCIDEKAWGALPEPERTKVMQDYDTWTQGVVRGGQYRASGKLQPVATATTVRERNGKRLVLDGPFAETREQLGGYHLVECKDLDEAISIAGKIPTLRVGGVVEVRPLEPMPHR